MLEYRDAVERFPPAINLAMQVGHSTLRAATMDDLERPATADEIGRMGELLDAAMAAGAIGMSTGLAYAPAAHAPTEEVIALVSRLKAHNGIHTTHMRNEEGAVLESVEETIRIGKEADVPVGDFPSQGRRQGELGARPGKRYGEYRRRNRFRVSTWMSTPISQVPRC